MLQIYMKTDIGLVRHSNQDAVKAGVLSGNTAWAVVCDGMGGANGGNIASALAVDLISEQILSSGSELRHLQCKCGDLRPRKGG